MKFGKLNVLVGAFIILLGAMGGLALGLTIEPSFSSGSYEVSSARFFLREGHTHGMPFALLSMIVGLLIDRLALSDKLKRLTSFLALGIFFLPIGLILRGITFPSKALAPVGMLGALFFMATAFLILLGSIKRGKDSE